MDGNRKAVYAVVAVAIVVVSAFAGVALFNKSADLSNSEFRVVVTDSMAGEPMNQYEIATIPVNSLIAVHKIDSGSVGGLKVGDVVGFRNQMFDEPIFHRIVGIDAAENKLTTKGDNSETTETVAFGDVTGVVVNVNHPAGEIVVFVKNNLVTLICFIIAAVLAVEAVSYYRKNRRED